jgi:hypothetical protein
VPPPVFHKSKYVIDGIPKKQADLMGKGAGGLEAAFEIVKVDKKGRIFPGVPPEGGSFLPQTLSALGIPYFLKQGADPFVRYGFFKQCLVEGEDQEPPSVFPQHHKGNGGGEEAGQAVKAAFRGEGKQRGGFDPQEDGTAMVDDDPFNLFSHLLLLHRSKKYREHRTVLQRRSTAFPVPDGEPANPLGLCF